MRIFFKKFSITLSVLFIAGVAYLYMTYSLEKDPQVSIAYGSSLVTVDGEVNPLSLTDEKMNADISFLNTLTTLKQIKIDNSIFGNQLFNKLKDNTVAIDPVLPGRENPFAPIELSIIKNNSGLAVLMTSPASQITSNGAILNGTVKVAVGVKNIYFEYGLTEALGSNTTILKQSLVGNFSKSISGLTPETTYYYQAVAEINGIKKYGEIVSFTTAQ